MIPMERAKVVHDPVHGSISVDGVFMEVMDRHEMQRLRSVKQLGLGYLVFPGANHTRFEHSLGAYHLAGRMADAIGLGRDDRDTVRMAGMLHDICHPPYSHTLESMMESALGMDHMDLARALVTGRVPNHLPIDDFLDGADTIGDVLTREGISPEEVCDLIAYPESRSDGLDRFTGGHSFFPSKDYAHQIIHGPVDADQMDYLMRDAHYTGMTHGAIDCERLVNTMRVHNDRIVIQRRGVTAAEGLMVSRSLMYTSVYYHETVRIAQRMLTKAVSASGIDLSDVFLRTDSDLMQMLMASGGRSARTVRRILNRDLDKRALVIYGEDVDDNLVDTLLQYSGEDGRSRLEREIADAAGVDPYDVGAEVTPISSLRSNMRIGKTDVAILDSEGKVRSLTRFSPIARALQSRDTYGWAVLVSAPSEKCAAVGRAARRILGSGE